jgi:hypothetical protein
VESSPSPTPEDYNSTPQQKAFVQPASILKHNKVHHSHDFASVGKSPEICNVHNPCHCCHLCINQTHSRAHCCTSFNENPSNHVLSPNDCRWVEKKQKSNEKQSAQSNKETLQKMKDKNASLRLTYSKQVTKNEKLRKELLELMDQAAQLGLGDFPV